MIPPAGFADNNNDELNGITALGKALLLFMVRRGAGPEPAPSQFLSSQFRERKKEFHAKTPRGKDAKNKESDRGQISSLKLSRIV